MIRDKKFEILGGVCAIVMFVGIGIAFDLQNCDRLGHGFICGPYTPSIISNDLPDPLIVDKSSSLESESKKTITQITSTKNLDLGTDVIRTNYKIVYSTPLEDWIHVDQKLYDHSSWIDPEYCEVDDYVNGSGFFCNQREDIIPNEIGWALKHTEYLKIFGSDYKPNYCSQYNTNPDKCTQQKLDKIIEILEDKK